MQRYTVLQEWTDNVTTVRQLSKLLCPPFGHILIANTNTRNACVKAKVMSQFTARTNSMKHLEESHGKTQNRKEFLLPDIVCSSNKKWHGASRPPNPRCSERFELYFSFQG